MKLPTFNLATLKSFLRGLAGVGVGALMILVHEPKYAPFAAILPFVLRYVDPTEKEIGLGKTIATDVLSPVPAVPVKK